MEGFALEGVGGAAVSGGGTGSLAGGGTGAEAGLVTTRLAPAGVGTWWYSR